VAGLANTLGKRIVEGRPEQALVALLLGVRIVTGRAVDLGQRHAGVFGSKFGLLR
jgi:hypothetical protein